MYLMPKDILSVNYKFMQFSVVHNFSNLHHYLIMIKGLKTDLQIEDNASFVILISDCYAGDKNLSQPLSLFSFKS